MLRAILFFYTHNIVTSETNIVERVCLNRIPTWSTIDNYVRNIQQYVKLLLRNYYNNNTFCPEQCKSNSVRVQCSFVRKLNFKRTPNPHVLHPLYKRSNDVVNFHGLNRYRVVVCRRLILERIDRHYQRSV